MAHYKRRRPKNRRAGCLMCKAWKANGVLELDNGDSLGGNRVSSVSIKLNGHVVENDGT